MPKHNEITLEFGRFCAQNAVHPELFRNVVGTVVYDLQRDTLLFTMDAHIAQLEKGVVEVDYPKNFWHYMRWRFKLPYKRKTVHFKVIDLYPAIEMPNLSPRRRIFQEYWPEEGDLTCES